MADFSFQNNRTLADYLQSNIAAQKADELAQQELLAKRQALERSANLPAALQLANEYQTALAAGDINRANAISQFAKTQEKGFQLNQSGATVLPADYASALTDKSYAIQQGTNASNINSAEPLAVAKSRGENASELIDRESLIPQLEDTVKSLSALGKKATFTKAGQLRDFFIRQGNFKPSEGMLNRAEYVALVDNQILPLLRQTFGAQFTQKEGESLKVTLGDPDKSPEEKDAVLRSFLDQKYAQIESLKRAVQGNNLFEAGKQKFNASKNPPALPLQGAADIIGNSGGTVDFSEYFKK